MVYLILTNNYKREVITEKLHISYDKLMFIRNKTAINIPHKFLMTSNLSQFTENLCHIFYL